MSALRVAILTTDKRDHDRDYADPVPSFGTAPEALFQGFSTVPEIEVHVVSCTQKPLTAPEKIGPNIFFHSLTVSNIGWLKTGYQGCIRAIRHKLREIQPDLVHGQGTERDCALGAVLSGFPNVLTIHGNMRLVSEVNNARPFSFLWFAALLERLTIPRTDGVVCITRYTQAAVTPLAQQTWLLPNAVDKNFFQVARTASDTPLLICVGAICLRKNQNRLIQALDSVANARALRVVFLGAVGDDAYGMEFRHLIEARPWCEHAGFADRVRLRGWFARATGLLLPSLEDNCPMVVLEAMASGVPVIAANVGGVPDLVEQRVTGLLCDPLDQASMAEAVSTLLDDPQLATSMAFRARQQAEQRYHPTVVARGHLEIYREILTSKR